MDTIGINLNMGSAMASSAAFYFSPAYVNREYETRKGPQNLG